MERVHRLSPPQHLFLEQARQVPEADIASVETYLSFMWVAKDLFVSQQAFFGSYNLSEGKLAVLLLLGQAPQYRLTPSALAERAGVTRGTVTGLLAGLERSGLAKRDEHPEDRRMFTITLTESALTLLEQIMPERINRIMACMAVLTQEEQHHLRILLQKLHDGLSALGAS